jgi:hypothetical protein
MSEPDRARLRILGPTAGEVFWHLVGDRHDRPVTIGPGLHFGRREWIEELFDRVDGVVELGLVDSTGLAVVPDGWLAFVEWDTDERGRGVALWEGGRRSWSLTEGPDGVLWDETGDVLVERPWQEDGEGWESVRDRSVRALAAALGVRRVILDEAERREHAPEGDAAPPREADDLDF